MPDDLWDYMTVASAERAAAEALRAARERRTMAELLLARGQQKAAAVVAMSGYRCNCVDKRDITGAGQFSGLCLEVQLVDPEPGWERDLFDRLFRGQGGAVLALPEGDRDGGS